MAEENNKPQEDNNKDKLKALESDIKQAFKEDRFEDVKKLATEIKSVDAENRLATKLVEKIAAAKAKADAKAKEGKIKEYQEMLSKLKKEGNFENLRKLTAEMKEFDPENKTIEKWMKTADELESKVKREKNKEQIKAVESDIKTAFKENQFEQVKKFAEQLKELDPANKTGENFVGKIEKAKLEADRKANAERINALVSDIKTSFKENQFEQVKKLAEKLKELDPVNKVGEKFVGKIEKAKLEADRKANAEKIDTLEDQIKLAFKEDNFEVAKKTIEKLQELDKESKFAMKCLAKIAKKEGVEAPKPAEAKEAEAGEKKSFFSKIFGKKKEKDIHLDKTKQKSEAKEVDSSGTAKSEPKKVEAKAEKKEEVKAEAPKAPEAKSPAAPVAPVTEAAPEPAKTEAPTASVAPVAVAPVAQEPAKADAEVKAVEAKSEAPALKTSEPEAGKEAVKAEGAAEETEKGNVFTKMFGQGKEDVKPAEQSKSIIDNIVEKTSEGKAEKAIEKKEAKSKEKLEGVALYHGSQAFVKFALAFVVITASFFYVQNMDTNNYVLGLVSEKENYASQLHAASAELETLEDEERELNKDINLYQKGYNNRFEEIVAQIVANRLNWPDILAKINEITDSVYERNAISQYVQYSSFSFDAEKGEVRVTGSLSDPLGKNLTKLIELEEAFKFYPSDPTDPNDQTKPYFYEFKEFSSLSKSFNKQTNKYTSNFQLSFALAEAEEE